MRKRCRAPSDFPAWFICASRPVRWREAEGGGLLRPRDKETGRIHDSAVFMVRGGLAADDRFGPRLGTLLGTLLRPLTIVSPRIARIGLNVNW